MTDDPRAPRNSQYADDLGMSRDRQPADDPRMPRNPQSPDSRPSPRNAQSPDSRASQDSAARRTARSRRPVTDPRAQAEYEPYSGEQSAAADDAETSGWKQRFQRSPRRESRDEKKPGFIRRTVNGWWDRLLGSVHTGGLSGQEAEYASHQTKHDYLWNTVGQTSWGMVFPLLTIVITQLSGADQAGMFSLAFVTASLLMILANYGVRTFQVSDISERQSFANYQVHRFITCILMMLVGLAYCTIRGYTGEMMYICVGVYLYKMVDGLADVYEGRLQQVDKLYLAGVSQMVRSLSVFVIFCIALLISGSLAVASVAMAITAFVALVFVTMPLAFMETPKSRRLSLKGVAELFRQCTPLFVALFLYAFIDNMPKFVMEGILSYDNQLYFNALYFPAQSILLTVGFIYKPLLVRMANAWADVKHRKRFDLFIVVVLALIVAITAVAIFLMNWIGIPITSFMYGVDFEQFRDIAIIMLVAGGITGGIDFLYQVITVLRRQKVVTGLYLITFVFSLIVPLLMVNLFQLRGAVVGYVIVMGILFLLLLREYIHVRLELARHPEDDPMLDVEPVAGAVVPEEARTSLALADRQLPPGPRPRL